jgi:hypothetical protein
MRSSYVQSTNGDIYSVGKVLYIACCDCGLVHRYTHQIVERKTGKQYKPGPRPSRFYILQRVERANRETGQQRRRRGIRIRALDKHSKAV